MLLKKPGIFLGIGLIISGCGYWIQKERSQIIHTMDTENIIVNMSITHCAGKGQISSANPLKGKLYFSFTSTRDSSQIHIKDFLGRRLYSVHGNTQDILIINHQDNIKHNLNNLIQNYSLRDVVTPDVLQKYLWGIIPISDTNSAIESNLKIEDGSILFSANKFPENNLIDTVIISLNTPKIDLKIEIIEREFHEDPHFYQTKLNN